MLILLNKIIIKYNINYKTLLLMYNKMSCRTFGY